MIILLTHQAAAHKILMESELADDLPPVDLDSDKIEQLLLLNLVLNAFDSVSAKGKVFSARFGILAQSPSKSETPGQASHLTRLDGFLIHFLQPRTRAPDQGYR